MKTKGLNIIIILFCICFAKSAFGQAEYLFFKSFDQTQIAFTDEGNGNAVILLHGFISNGTSWSKTPLKADLIAAGYRVIVPDLRGNGKSDKPHDAKAYDGTEVKDLSALLDFLKLNKVEVIGYSRGSIVLAKWLTTEKRIKKAVIGGMGLDFTNPQWDRRLKFGAAFSGEAPLDNLTEGAVTYAKSIGADLAILGLLQKYQPVTSIEELHKIKIPVLVIAGTEDIDNGKPEDIVVHFKKGLIEKVPGTHNETHKSQAFSDKIIDFLKT